MKSQQTLFTNTEIEKIRDDIREDIRSITQSLRISSNIFDSNLEMIPIILKKVRDIEDRLFNIENKLPSIEERVLDFRKKGCNL